MVRLHLGKDIDAGLDEFLEVGELAMAGGLRPGTPTITAGGAYIVFHVCDPRTRAIPLCGITAT